MAESRSLYDEDFVRWSEEQAAAIRSAAASGANLPLDWDNLAEEIESLGKSLQRELSSRTRTIIEHLLKLEWSHSPGPRSGWKETVRRNRAEIETLLKQNPSLRRTLDDVLSGVGDDVAEDVAEALSDVGELDGGARAKLKAASYTTTQVFGRWFPEDAS